MLLYSTKEVKLILSKCKTNDDVLHVAKVINSAFKEYGLIKTLVINELVQGRFIKHLN